MNSPIHRNYRNGEPLNSEVGEEYTHPETDAPPLGGREHDPIWIENSEPLAPTDLARLEREIAAEQQRIRRRRTPDFTLPPPPPPRKAPPRNWGRIGALAATLLLSTAVGLYLTDRLPAVDAWLNAGDCTRQFASVDPSGTVSDAKPADGTTVKLQERAAPRLVASGASADSGEEISIGVAVEGRTEEITAVVSGLEPGTTLSAGRAWGTTGWLVPADRLGEAMLRPPANFSGIMEYSVALRLPDNSIVDRQTMRLDWAPVPPKPAPQQAAAPAAPPAQPAKQTPAPAPQARQPVAAAQPAAPTSTAPAMAAPPAPAQTAAPRVPAPQVQQAARTPAPQSAAPAAAPAAAVGMNAEEIALLLKRGEELFSNGDIAGSRVLLRRAAEAQDARAAVALAATYDPIVLQKLGVYGARPDVAMARSWYEKAVQYGSKEAPKRLELLASHSR